MGIELATFNTSSEGGSSMRGNRIETRGTSGVPVCLAALFAAAFASPAFGQGRVKEVVIYRDMPAAGVPDTRPASALYFEPFYYMPREKAADIAVRADFPARDLDRQATGTCLEYTFEFGGADEWASAAFIPAGGKPGTRPPRDIAQDLAAEQGQKIYLKFKARRPANTTAVVSFRVGGMGVGEHVDGIRPPAKSKPLFIPLTADWVEYKIDLSEHAQGLSKVVSPFSVVVQSNDHRGERSVKFYVDEIRFVAE
jgi:hypothetical protein